MWRSRQEHKQLLSSHLANHDVLKTGNKTILLEDNGNIDVVG
jgi:hypothetical protein